MPAVQSIVTLTLALVLLGCSAVSHPVSTDKAPSVAGEYSTGVASIENRPGSEVFWLYSHADRRLAVYTKSHDALELLCVRDTSFDSVMAEVANAVKSARQN